MLSLSDNETSTSSSSPFVRQDAFELYGLYLRSERVDLQHMNSDNVPLPDQLKSNLESYVKDTKIKRSHCRISVISSSVAFFCDK